MTMYTVETVDNAWSYINGPNGYREGPYRYRWEAEEYAGKLERGELAPRSNGELENDPST